MAPSKKSAPKSAAPLPAPSAWSGPLPDPASVERFEHILPGAAQRLFALAEREQAHRHAQEIAQMEIRRASVRMAARDSLLGMFLGWLVAMGGMGCAVWSVMAQAHWSVSLGFLSLPVMLVAAELVRRQS